VTATNLFDLSEQYEEMLRMGVSLSGEDPEYFMKARVNDLRRWLPQDWKPRRALDFGCGTGETAAYLATAFPGTQVVGVDTAIPALELAERRHGSPHVAFRPVESLKPDDRFDLCYVNGVFHHIEPERRLDALHAVRQAMIPGGYIALFENNPWNPGTRMVMRRIPFDRDARTLSFLQTQKLLCAGGFHICRATRFLFYFPRALSFLRFAEPALLHIPLGAQYCVIARTQP
jgi:SAM-dependent methyltransferase